jgi:hypothetical protein
MPPALRAKDSDPVGSCEELVAMIDRAERHRDAIGDRDPWDDYRVRWNVTLVAYAMFLRFNYFLSPLVLERAGLHNLWPLAVLGSLWLLGAAEHYRVRSRCPRCGARSFTVGPRPGTPPDFGRCCRCRLPMWTDPRPSPIAPGRPVGENRCRHFARGVAPMTRRDDNEPRRQSVGPDRAVWLTIGALLLGAGAGYAVGRSKATAEVDIAWTEAEQARADAYRAQADAAKARERLVMLQMELKAAEAKAAQKEPDHPAAEKPVPKTEERK